MTQIIRQGATGKLSLGPCVAVGDGFTPVTTLTIAAADDKRVLKSDGTTAVMGGTLAAIASADGWYDYAPLTGETDTVGVFTIIIQDDSLCLPVCGRFQVVEEAIYDALYATSAVGALAGVALVSTGADLILSSSTFAAAMADAILLRNASNVETTAGEHTLCTVILAMMEHSISGTTLTIKRTDGATTHATKTLTVNAAADPITGIT